MIELQTANESETPISQDGSRPVPPDCEFLTVKQTAEFLNISASNIYKMYITRKLAHYRFGEGAGSIRINRADLTEFIKRCHVEEQEGEVRVVAAHRTTPYVYQCLDFRPMHPCGAMTKAGTPCTHRTREERCHLHLKKKGTTA